MARFFTGISQMGKKSKTIIKNRHWPWPSLRSLDDDFVRSWTDPSRVYYGTDTRAFDLLAGCALAFVWPFNRLSPVVPRKSKAVLNIAGTISILCFILFTAFVSEYQPFLYRGGLLLVAILGVIMIATISHPPLI